MSNESPRHCRPDLPLSVVLGAGAVRGLAHVGVLEVLLDAGFSISEMVGTSVGALITGFYGAVGLALSALREAGLGLRSSHLFAWAFLRRIPPRSRQRYCHFAGRIPRYFEALAGSPWERRHHGLSHIGIDSYDLISNSQVVCH